MHLGLRVSLAALAVLATTGSIAAFQAAAPSNAPHWPFPADAPKGSVDLSADDGQPRHLPDSAKSYTLKQVEGAAAVDWFPDTHPKAPVSVTEGKADVYHACGRCHLINGNGRPDSQSLNALPIAYMEQQLEDMKSDLRQSSIVFGDVIHMNHVAKDLSEADEKQALAYFHSIPAAKWVRVVETDTVPKTTPGLHGLPVLDPAAAKEPIGTRILELPESYDRAVLRDPTSGFIAYVPTGSVKKGEAIVTTGAGGHTMACITCHGADLRHGLSDIMPPIAGRSPTALARQLYNFKSGARHGKNSVLMTTVVDKLTDDDIVNIAAYLASLPQ